MESHSNLLVSSNISDCWFNVKLFNIIIKNVRQIIIATKLDRLVHRIGRGLYCFVVIQITIYSIHLLLREKNLLSLLDMDIISYSVYIYWTKYLTNVAILHQGSVSSSVLQRQVNLFSTLPLWLHDIGSSSGRLLSGWTVCRSRNPSYFLPSWLSFLG
jgi:hypothetical protein